MTSLPHPFSFEGRARSLGEMGRSQLDVLVVGGGITGAGIARDAALRGWTVALVEQEDFGFGTSSRSSKIIHGGVRYLEYGQFLLVRESARERKVLRRIAPHLVHPLGFVYPVFGEDRFWLVRAGLALFDRMASANAAERHRNLGPAQVRERLPGLRDPLKGGVIYREYITDDARFTMENALSAALHGALVANHAPASLIATGGRVVGAEVVDSLTGRTHTVHARVVVNATGAWAEQTLATGGVGSPKPLVPSKGIHLLIDAAALPIQGACFLKASNGRRGLAMRRLNHVYVGTSDEEYRGPLASPRATRAEVEKLLAMVQNCFPSAGLRITGRARHLGRNPPAHQRAGQEHAGYVPSRRSMERHAGRGHHRGRQAHHLPGDGSSHAAGGGAAAGRGALRPRPHGRRAPAGGRAGRLPSRGLPRLPLCRAGGAGCRTCDRRAPDLAVRPAARGPARARGQRPGLARAASTPTFRRCAAKRGSPPSPRWRPR